MEVEIINLRRKDSKNYKNYFYCGRGSDVGNPFIIGKHGNRKSVIYKYTFWFIRKNIKESQDFQKILKCLRENGKVVLGCFCEPLPCHCDVIKKKLLNYEALDIDLLE